MPTDPHFSCCQQGSNVCQRPGSQRGGHLDLHLHICFAKHNTLEVWKAPVCTKKWDVITGGPYRRNCLCLSFSRQDTEFSLCTKFFLHYSRWCFTCELYINKKKKATTFLCIPRENRIPRGEKEPHTLSSFRKMPIFSISLLGVWSDDQESAWSELLEGPCCWSLPSTEASCLGSEGFQRSFQIFLFPAVSGFFSYLRISVLMVMCLQLMPR